MMKTRVMIIDDEALARERIRRFLSSCDETIEIVAEAEHGRDGLSAIQEHQPDLIFLDIQMPEMDGFEMLSRLDSTQRPAVIFTTAYDEYAIKAFEVHALDYLLKPFSRERLLLSLERVRISQPEAEGGLQQKLDALLEQIQRPEVTRLSIKDQGRVHFLDLDRIHWIESAGNYVVVHHEGGNDIMRETMTHLENLLPEQDFVRLSRSAIVRLDAVVEIGGGAKGDQQVVLSSGEKIKSSMSLKELQQRMERLG